MTETKNRKLECPGPDDYVDIALLNRNAEKIDTALVDPALHLADGERARWDAMTPQTRKVNGKPLTADISLTAADVGARPASWTPSADDTGAVPSGRKINGKPLTADITLAAADVGAVPTARKINGKPLTADVALAAGDVGARPSTWNPNIADCAGTLAVAKGGTGATTVAAARNALGLGNTAGALPVANGGTGINNLIGTDYGTARVRGIYAGTGDMTPGSTALANGVIYLMYE